jgi:hypothetical protein
LNCLNADDQRLFSVANDYAVGFQFAQVIEMRNVHKAALQAALMAYLLRYTGTPSRGKLP